MEDKLKEIISGYLKIPVSEISTATRIDRSAVGNSIYLHRMYGRIAEAGYNLNDYADILNFGELLSRLQGKSVAKVTPKEEVVPGNGVGVDIEEIGNMPVVADFRADGFYTVNFSSEEIAYCILQNNPYASFAGIFAAKEAIVKANGAYRKSGFREIVIGHDQFGKPVKNGFQLSISHTETVAIAVAVEERGMVAVNGRLQGESVTVNKGNFGAKGLCFLAGVIISFLVFYFIWPGR
ncbi:MAG: 4'-phosphopantetheinyl transferase superfamily protein [Bacteroidetes bacterium]|nr:4'-phosphopantetheinyl transferase superfamily protein [Bacteroidota bacterium]